MLVIARSSTRSIAMADQLNNKSYGAWIAIDIARDFNAVLSETKEGKRQHFRMANSASVIWCKT
jgi:hypothetical protein